MELNIVERAGQRYASGRVGQALIHRVEDCSEVIGQCWSDDVRRLLLDRANLPAQFFELRSGVAGEILQKFRTYGIKVAAVLSPDIADQGAFSRMVAEENRGPHFRFFRDRHAAEDWLLDES